MEREGLEPIAIIDSTDTIPIKNVYRAFESPLTRQSVRISL